MQIGDRVKVSEEGRRVYKDRMFAGEKIIAKFKGSYAFIQDAPIKDKDGNDIVYASHQKVKKDYLEVVVA